MTHELIIVGAGLAGIVAAVTAADLGIRVLLLDQEAERNLGGQAFWSLGGLFLVNSPEQRRLGIRDSAALAWQDWQQAASFTAEDEWPRRWAQAYVEWSAGPKREWLHRQGLRFFPIVGWAERGLNSIPRFHLTWGTGPGVLEPFIRRLHEHRQTGQINCLFRHRVQTLLVQAGMACGVQGDVLEETAALRSERSSRVVVDDFEFRAAAVILTSGGMGGNLELVRQHWPQERLGPPPTELVCGVPAHVDGLLQQAAVQAGALLSHPDRMWHYTEGLHNWNPIWPNHGIRVLPGPSSLWLNPSGQRLPFPHVPGFSTLDTLQYLGQQGYGHSWFVLNRAIIKKEFALSGSEQNPDLTNKSFFLTLKSRIGRQVQRPVQAFMEKGADFVVRSNLNDLVQAMNELSPGQPVDLRTVKAEVIDHTMQLLSPSPSDQQLQLIRRARRWRSERILRVAPPKPLLTPQNGPLIAVKLHLLTRKSLGGLATDLDGQVLRPDGQVFPGLYAAGEVAGFGGGGYHGFRALEGTFLGGCLFSGLRAGEAAAQQIR